MPTNALDLYLRGLPSKRPQLELAERLPQDPTPLVSAFKETVAAFGNYDNLGAFHDAPTAFEKRPWPPGSAHDVAAKIAEVGGLTTPRPLRYLDREIGASAGGVALGARKVDLLLADADRRPVLCEVKLRADRNAFYAVVQLLAAAVPLLGATQRSRLRLWASGPAFVLVDSATIDLLVLLVDPPQKPLDQQLLVAAAALAQTLLGVSEVKELVCRLDIAATTWSAIAPKRRL